METLPSIFLLVGCLADYRVGEKNLDDDPSVEVKRFNVEKTCPCLFLKCLNGGICMAGSPPYCICPAGYTGPTCSILITEPKSGEFSPRFFYRLSIKVNLYLDIAGCYVKSITPLKGRC